MSSLTAILNQEWTATNKLAAEEAKAEGAALAAANGAGAGALRGGKTVVKDRVARAYFYFYFHV